MVNPGWPGVAVVSVLSCVFPGTVCAVSPRDVAETSVWEEVFAVVAEVGDFDEDATVGVAGGVGVEHRPSTLIVCLVLVP